MVAEEAPSDRANPSIFALRLTSMYSMRRCRSAGMKDTRAAMLVSPFRANVT
jgi:hypothetical protein